jgi:hypothetical protein
MLTRKTHAARIAFIAGLLVVALALVPVSLAGKGGRHNGGSTSTGPALTGFVSGSSYTVNGTGFKPGEIVMLTIGEAGGCCNARNIVPDASGAFTYVGTIWGSGTYTIRASEYINSRWQVVATWSFVA